MRCSRAPCRQYMIQRERAPCACGPPPPAGAACAGTRRRRGLRVSRASRAGISSVRQCSRHALVRVAAAAAVQRMQPGSWQGAVQVGEQGRTGTPWQRQPRCACTSSTREKAPSSLPRPTRTRGVERQARRLARRRPLLCRARRHAQVVALPVAALCKREQVHTKGGLREACTRHALVAILATCALRSTSVDKQQVCSAGGVPRPRDPSTHPCSRRCPRPFTRAHP